MSRVIKSTNFIYEENEYVPIPTKEINNNVMEEEENFNKKELQIDIKAQILEEAKKASEEIIMKSKIEGEKIIKDAYEKAKIILEEAKKIGYEEGKIIGFNEGKDYADSLIKEALTIKNEVIKKKKEILDSIEGEVIDLVIYTIEKILDKKINEESDLILNIIKSGLNRCSFTESLTIRVSPYDYDLVMASKDKILALSENIENITIKEDKSLKKGSCIIDTLSGSVDSSISSQLEAVKTLFYELLKSE